MLLQEAYATSDLERLQARIAELEAERDLAIEQRNMGAEIIEGNCKIMDALKAERAVLQGVVTSYAMTERELKAERDRLQRERDGIELELCQRAERWEAERDRLRAVLEKALGAIPGSADWHEACRALEGK